MTAVVDRPTAGQPRLSSGRPVATLAAWLLAVAIGQTLVLIDIGVPVLRQAAGAAVLVGLPVALLTRRWHERLGTLPAFLYAVGATCFALLAVPLVINTALPWLGVDRPLSRPALVAAWSVVDLALVVRYRPGLPRRQTLRRVGGIVWRARLRPAVTLAAVAVLLAVTGAVRLNNGHGGAVAVLAHAAAILAAAAVTLRRGSRARDVTVIYLSGLALLLGTSLRGWYITGHDIQNEYLAYLYTHRDEHWVMSAYPTPYNACLSVNILPHTLGVYLGLDGVVVFKVVLQALFALVPVCVYVIARRVVPARLAALSVLLFMAFPTFYTDMPFLVRQEVAYVFVALVLLAATQDGWSVRRCRIASYGFAVGVIMSHYATTYLLVITLVIGLVGVGLGRIRRRFGRRRERLAVARAPRPDRPRHAHHGAQIRRHGPLILLHPLVVIAAAATAWTWSTPLTHSGGHLAETVNTLASALIKGDSLAGSSDLKYSVVFGSGPTEAERLADYVADVRAERDKEKAADFVFPRPTGSVASPQVAEREPLPMTPVGHALARAGLPVGAVNALLRLGSAAVIQLSLLLGLLALVFYSKVTRTFSREMFWLVLGSIGALASVAVVPGLSASYGVLRAFQQTLIFAAPVVAIGLMSVTAPLRRLRPALPTVTATGVGTLVGVTLTGALPATLGDYDAVLSQSNSGAYYEQLYTAAPQLATARWLASATRGKGLQYANASDIVAVTRLQMYLPRSVTVDSQFLPLQLRKGVYLVLGPQTVDDGTAGVFYTGDVLTYRYPTSAVERRLDIVYSTPGNRVLR